MRKVEPPPERRRAWWIRPASTRSFLIVMTVGSVASVLALAIGLRPLLRSARDRQAALAAKDRQAALAGAGKSTPADGDAGHTPADVVVVRVVRPGSDLQGRTTDSEQPQALGPGERIRVGVQSGTHSFLFGFSLDERGVMTPLFSDGASSMALSTDGRMRFLPPTLELTGAGAERLVLLLTAAPLSESNVRAAAAVAFKQAGGDLRRLSHLSLPVPGTQIHRAFIKVVRPGGPESRGVIPDSR